MAVIRTCYLDPLAIVLYDKSGQRSGFELQKHLEQHGCFAEMADPRYVVLVFGIQTSLEDMRRLQQAIETLTQCKLQGTYRQRQLK